MKLVEQIYKRGQVGQDSTTAAVLKNQSSNGQRYTQCWSAWKQQRNITDESLTFSSGVCGILQMRWLNSRPSSTRKLSFGCRMPHLVAIERAVFTLSPVTIRTVIPAPWHLRIASGTYTWPYCSLSISTYILKAAAAAAVVPVATTIMITRQDKRLFQCGGQEAGLV